jgi:hypothetical protein
LELIRQASLCGSRLLPAGTKLQTAATELEDLANFMGG